MRLSPLDVSQLSASWSFADRWSLTPLAGGMNNFTWRVETSDRQHYVLRLGPDLTRLASRQYEAALLQALSAKELPFLLPVPIPTRSGELLVTCKLEIGVSAIATLHPFLPGTPPDRNDPLSATKAAVALAQLDLALASLPGLQLSGEVQSLPTFGELLHGRVHISDPLKAVERLPIERAQARKVQAFLSLVIEKVDAIYAALPQQLLHRDYDPTNLLLLQDQRVTAVLDFELAGHDIRVLDLCVALSWWPVDLLGSGEEWEIFDAFGAAYLANFPLCEAELLALPDVWRLRDAVSLVHRMERYFVGLVTDERIKGRVQHTLWLEEWTAANAGLLLEHALSWA